MHHSHAHHCHTCACASFLQVWNDQLASLALFWAASCEFMLNEDRNGQSSEYAYIGQTMAATINYNVNYTVLLGTWFQEGVYYSINTGYCTDADGNQEENIDESICARYVQVGTSAATLHFSLRN